jgi:hypothetical protein
MVPRNFGGTSGVIVDVCKEHGVWLDHAELEKVLAFVRGGGLARARERELARVKEETERALSARSAGLSPAGFGPDPFSPPRTSSEADLTGVLGWLGAALVRAILRGPGCAP